MAGGGFAMATSLGIFTGEASASETFSGGPGCAIHLGYGYDQFDWFGFRSGFNVFGEYRSSDYATVSTYLGQAFYNVAGGASYTQLLPNDVTAGLSGSYYHLDKAGVLDPRDVGDSWQVDFSLARELWTSVNGSLSVGYGRDQAVEYGTNSYANQNGFQVLARLVWASDGHTTVIASYDSRTQIGEVMGVVTSENQGLGAWTATAEAQTSANNQDGLGASVTYAGNHGDISVTQSAGLTGFGFSGVSGLSSTEERTTVAAASSLVFADGAWGVGRTVTNGFAVVTPHPTLEGSSVVLGPSDAPVARTDWLGSGVVPSLAAYRTARVAYDAPEAPTGYDLGSATYDINAPYKAGYALQVGSAYTTTTIGTLLDAEGKPVELLAGVVREAGKENGHKVEIFTNRAGRFGAQGLAPGRWIIEMSTEGEPTRYVIDIPEGMKGLHRAGTLKPDGSAGQKKPPVVEAKMETEDNGTN